MTTLNSVLFKDFAKSLKTTFFNEDLAGMTLHWGCFSIFKDLCEIRYGSDFSHLVDKTSSRLKTILENIQNFEKVLKNIEINSESEPKFIAEIDELFRTLEALIPNNRILGEMVIVPHGITLYAMNKWCNDTREPPTESFGLAGAGIGCICETNDPFTFVLRPGILDPVNGRDLTIRGISARGIILSAKEHDFYWADLVPSSVSSRRNVKSWYPTRLRGFWK